MSKSKRVLILRDVPRIDRYVYTVVRPDGSRDHFTTRLAAFQFMKSMLPPDALGLFRGYAQVCRILAKHGHYTFAHRDRRIFQLLAEPVNK